jgi:hypothetical protein
MKTTISKRAASIGTCAGLAVAALSVGGVALANGSSTIHACANKHTGALSLANHCKSGYKAVSWNQAGPQGPQGPQGAQGAQGASGAPAYVSRFVWPATSGNVAGDGTVINDFYTNGDPNAVLEVTQRWTGIYDPASIGIWYAGGHWIIFDENAAAMPVGAQFNVVVVSE